MDLRAVFDHFWSLFQQDYKSFLNLPVPDQTLYIYPLGYSNENPSVSPFDLHEEIHDILHEEGVLSIVIQGAGGSGKTSMALEFCNELWSDVQQDDPSTVLPLYIHLATVYKYKCNYDELILNYMQSKGKCYKTECSVCSHEDFAKELEAIARDLRLILILDGYNELPDKLNLWEVNDWKNFDDARLRCIYFLRPDTFSRKCDMEAFFQYKYFDDLKNSIQERKSRHYTISTLKIEQRQSYISKFIKYLKKLSKKCNKQQCDRSQIWPMTVQLTKKRKIWLESAKEYQRWFKKLPSLKKIAEVPFILQLIMQVLPSAVEDGETENSKVHQFCRTEVGVFDAVVKYWFEFQAERVRSSENPLDLFQMEKNHLLGFYHVYCENLAVYLVERNKGNLTDLFLSELETKQHFLTDPVRSEEFNQVKIEKYSHIFPTKSPETDETKRKLGNLIELRNGCFLQSKFAGQNGSVLTFKFLHHSMVEYFAAKCIFQGLRGELNYYLSQNVGLCPEFVKFNRQPIEQLGLGVFNKIISRARSDDDFCACLFDIISKSRELSILRQMAANAATVLNFAGRSLSGLDWKEVQIPGANLNRANCANTDFSGANMADVKLQQSYLPFCRFNGTNFAAANFGEVNSIRDYALSKPCYASSRKPDQPEHILDVTSCRPGGYDCLIYSYSGQLYKYSFGKSTPVAFEFSTQGYRDHSGTLLDLNVFCIGPSVIGRLYGNGDLQNGIFLWDIYSCKLIRRIDPVHAWDEAESTLDNIQMPSLEENEDDPKLFDYETRIFSYSHQHVSGDKAKTTVTTSILICTTLDLTECTPVPVRPYFFQMFPWHCGHNFFSKSFQKKAIGRGVSVLCTSSRGKLAVCHNNQIRIIDAMTGQCDCTLPVKLPHAFSVVMTFSGVGQHFAFSDVRKYFLLGNADNNSFVKIPFENSSTAPTRLLFDTSGTNLLASFEYVEELLLISTEDSQVLRVIKPRRCLYTHRELQQFVWPMNFCFCAENDTHIAYLDPSNVVNIIQIAIDDQNSSLADPNYNNNVVPDREREDGEFAVNVRHFTVSRNGLYIAVILDNSDNPLGEENNLKIYFTPFKYSESLLSETCVLELRANEFCAGFTGSEATTNLIVLASYGIVRVYNIFTCDVLFKASLGDLAYLPELNNKWNSCSISPDSSIVSIEHEEGMKGHLASVFTQVTIQSLNCHPYLALNEIKSFPCTDPLYNNGTSIKTNANRHKLHNGFTACEVNLYELYICHLASKCGIKVKLLPRGEAQQEIQSFLLYGSSNLCIATSDSLHFYKLKSGPEPNSVLKVSCPKTVKHGINSDPLSMINCPEGLYRFFVIYEKGRIELRKTPSGKVVYAVDVWFTIDFAMGRTVCNATDSDSSWKVKLYICNGDGLGTFSCIEAGEEEHQFKVVWGSKPCYRLEAGNCDIGCCFEMDSKAIQLFKTQTGISGQPFPEKSCTQYDKRRYIALCDLLVGIKDEICADEMSPIIAASQNPDLHMTKISQQWWSVCATVKKSASCCNLNPHMSLTLEGIKNNRRFLVKADLSYMRHSDSAPKEVVILTMPFTKLEDLEGLKKRSRIQQFFITDEEGMKLLEEIRKDQRSVLTYNIVKKNCMSWVKGKLKIVGKTLRKHWYDIIIDYPR